MAELKVCTICKKEQELHFFQKKKECSDGHINQCKFCVKELVSKWRKENPEKYRAQLNRAREKRGTKETKEEFLNRKKKYAMGRNIVSNNYAHRRRSKLSIKDEMTEFVFAEASRLRDLRKITTGIDWHIDHIVPINHKLACGLHVAANFQVVPAEWNRQKRHLNMDIYFG